MKVYAIFKFPTINFGFAPNTAYTGLCFKTRDDAERQAELLEAEDLEHRYLVQLVELKDTFEIKRPIKEEKESPEHDL